MLNTSLRLLTLIAWVGCVFAQGYSHLLLYFYGGSRLVTDNPEAVNLLRIYALYLVLLAWNGPTEAFLNAAMTTVSVETVIKIEILCCLILCRWHGGHGCSSCEWLDHLRLLKLVRSYQKGS